MFKAKIVLIGPCETGKTVLANFLGDQTDNSQSSYHPTVGVRILEFESNVDNGGTIDVELWDCSGSDDYEECWPAMTYQADGVVIVYDPLQKSPNPSVESFYDCFVQNKGLKNSQCMLFANCKNREVKNVTSPVPSVPVIITNLEKNPDEIKDSFKRLLQNVLGKLSDSREREELSIIS